MRVLICYGTTEGQTRKIAEFIADLVTKSGHEAVLCDATTVGAVEASRADAAILAASIHIGRYQAALVHRARDWHERLNAIPSAFVSVSLSAASEDPHERAEVDEIAQKMLHETGWRPTATLHAAGALRFIQYDFFKRWAMKLIALQHRQSIDTKSDQEYTDWAELTRFAEAFLAKLPAAKTG